MKGLMLLLALALAGACAAPTGTEPVVAEPTLNEGDVPTCRSGYAIASRNGEWVCEPAEGEASASSTTAP